MNKTQLVDALTERLGDRRLAATALDGLLETIVDTVRAGGSVSITGFGVFEPRARAARKGRNPATGAPVDIPATTVPAFRPGESFRSAVRAVVPAPRTPVEQASEPAVVVSSGAAFAEPAAEPSAEARPGKNKSGKKAKAKDGKSKKGKKK